jgi:hypothetical protein
MDTVSFAGFERMYGYLASTMSYRVVAICLLSVPVTHVAGLNIRQQGSKSKGLGHGGNRHLLLACCSYVSAMCAPLWPARSLY